MKAIEQLFGGRLPLLSAMPAVTCTQAWRKGMAAYRRVNGLKSPAGAG